MFDFFKKDKTSETPASPQKSWTERLKQGLSRTRSSLGNQLANLFGGGKIDDALECVSGFALPDPRQRRDRAAF